MARASALLLQSAADGAAVLDARQGGSADGAPAAEARRRRTGDGGRPQRPSSLGLPSSSAAPVLSSGALASGPLPLNSKRPRHQAPAGAAGAAGAQLTNAASLRRAFKPPTMRFQPPDAAAAVPLHAASGATTLPQPHGPQERPPSHEPAEPSCDVNLASADAGGELHSSLVAAGFVSASGRPLHISAERFAAAAASLGAAVVGGPFIGQQQHCHPMTGQHALVPEDAALSTSVALQGICEVPVTSAFAGDASVAALSRIVLNSGLDSIDDTAGTAAALAHHGQDAQVLQQQVHPALEAAAPSGSTSVAVLQGEPDCKAGGSSDEHPLDGGVAAPDPALGSRSDAGVATGSGGVQFAMNEGERHRRPLPPTLPIEDEAAAPVLPVAHLPSTQPSPSPPPLADAINALITAASASERRPSPVVAAAASVQPHQQDVSTQPPPRSLECSLPAPDFDGKLSFAGVANLSSASPDPLPKDDAAGEGQGVEEALATSEMGEAALHLPSVAADSSPAPAEEAVPAAATAAEFVEAIIRVLPLGEHDASPSCAYEAKGTVLLEAEAVQPQPPQEESGGNRGHDPDLQVR